MIESSLYGVAVERLETLSRDDLEKLHYQWFNSKEQEFTVYNTLYQGMQGLVSNDLIKLLYGIMLLGWLMREEYEKRQVCQ